jgi:formylglycine-generating enzyme required for sulfatase activity
MTLATLLLSRDACAQKPAIEWVDIPAGTFTMGNPKSEVHGADDAPQHQVTLGAFRMSKYEITLAEFKAFIDSTGYQTSAEKLGGSCLLTASGEKRIPGVIWTCDEKGAPRPDSAYNAPVVHVSWVDADAFAKWLGCRLPTEAEWEYACRAGTNTAFSSGKCLDADRENYRGDAPLPGCASGVDRKRILPVGSLAPNAWGLYDMHGNVAEWCADWYGPYPSEAQAEPQGPAAGTTRVCRGGSWAHDAQNSRSARRTYPASFASCEIIGLRLVAGSQAGKAEEKPGAKDLGGGLKEGMTLRDIDRILGLGIDWNAFGGLMKSYLPENSKSLFSDQPVENTLSIKTFVFKFRGGLLVEWSKAQ